MIKRLKSLLSSPPSGYITLHYGAFRCWKQTDKDFVWSLLETYFLNVFKMYKHWKNNSAPRPIKHSATCRQAHKLPPLTFAFKWSPLKFTKRTSVVSFYHAGADLCYSFSFPHQFFSLPFSSVIPPTPDHTISKHLLIRPLLPHHFIFFAFPSYTNIFILRSNHFL